MFERVVFSTSGSYLAGLHGLFLGDIPLDVCMVVSLDHIFSISIALIGGVLWAKWGYQMVFLAGAVIAIINLVSAFFITTPPVVKSEAMAAVGK